MKNIRIFSIFVILVSIACSSLKAQSISTEPIGTSHQWIDLGLTSGTKWATCNVGASKPSEVGDHYAWGELIPFYQPGETPIPDNDLYEIAGNNAYDAATANWGAEWQTPTIQQFVELIKECTWTWHEIDSQNGHLITGPNGNQIFLPAGGSYSLSKYIFPNEEGDYWTSTLGENGIAAYDVYFHNGGARPGLHNRLICRNIRPVLK